MDESAKILVLGLSQAGKSSFINYFVGDDKAQVGKGKPCTTGYCIEYEYNGGGYPIKIYDNKGFETAIATEQKYKIINFIKEHNNSDQIMNWFHTIFYVTSAKKRFEPFERDFILELSESISQNIHIIITCCDGVSEKTLEEKKTFISEQLCDLGDKLHIFEVVSIRMKKFNGDIVEPYGKEEIIDSIFPLFWEDICGKVSKEYAHELYWDLNSKFEWLRAESYKMIDKMVSIRGFIDVINDDNSMLNSMMNSVDADMEETLEKLQMKYNRIIYPLANLFNSYFGIVSGDLFSIDDINIDPFSGDLNFDENFAFEQYFPNMNELANDGEPSFLGVVGAIGELLSLKKRFKSAIDDMVYSAKNHILSEDEIEEQVFYNLMEFLDDYSFGSSV